MSVSDRNNKVSYRRYWLPDLAWVGGLIVVTTILFWASDIDIAVARLFYSSGSPAGWFLGGENVAWVFLEDTVPFLTWGLLLGPLLIFLAGLGWKRLRPWRMHAIYILLSVAVGPGLLVNTVFKAHFGRPRPRQTIEFGGEFKYLPVLVPGRNEDCRSFASGHSSIGFAFCVFYFLYRRKRPRLALGCLAFSIVLGLVIGVARMAVGAHFLSDVLWSGFFSYLVALVIYYFVLRVPHWEDTNGHLWPQRGVRVEELA